MIASFASHFCMALTNATFSQAVLNSEETGPGTNRCLSNWCHF